MNETEVTIGGRVVADPEHRTTRGGMQFTTFRVASTTRRRNKEGVFVDGPTSFYNVATYRALGMNVHASLRKGDPVVVHGRQTVHSWQRTDESWGTSVDVEATSVGHDLRYVTSACEKAHRGGPDQAGEEVSRRSEEEMSERIAGGNDPGWTPDSSPGWGEHGAVPDGAGDAVREGGTEDEMPLSA